MNWAHVHLMINHVPVIGSLAVTLLLLWGLARKSRDVIRAGLLALVLVALASLPVVLTGEPAEHEIEDVPAVSEHAIDAHQEFAETSAVVLGVVGLVALIGLVKWRGETPIPRGYAVLVFLLSLVPLGMMFWTANLGGRIHHPEVRAGWTAPAGSGPEEAGE